MPALTPTIHERLARCGTSVPLTGLIAGAAVEVEVGGTLHTFVAGGGGHGLTVPPLNATEVVRARQDDGSGFTPWSPEVIVEDALVPPTASPLLPSQVGDCSQCVRVDGVVPGCEVELRQDGVLVGAGLANRHGWACVDVKLRGRDDKKGVLTARMLVCGVASPEAATLVVTDSSLGAPVVGGPLFGCQSVVPLSELRIGAKTRLETDTGTYLGWIRNCWTAVNVNVLHALVTNERVHAQQYYDSDTCIDDGPFSNWRLVEEPDERIRPVLEAPLIAGDRIIRVTNQIGGASIVVLLRDGEGLPETRFGPRAASEEAEIALNDALIAGQQVAVEQSLCGRVEVSNWVTVLPPPPVVLAPFIIPPLHACAGSVQVAGLHPGALVRVFQDGIVCGIGWAGLASSIAVAASPALVAGVKVTAKQWVGGVEGPESDAVIVQGVEQLHMPRIVGPVALGDTQVVVSGVSHGALVSIRTGSVLLGERYAAESLVRVGVSPVTGTVRPAVRLCDVSTTGQRVEAIDAPGGFGPEEASGELALDLGTLSIPVHTPPTRLDDGGFDSPVRGQLYFPADSSGQKIAPGAFKRPLVIIAHGYWNWDQEDQSHLGYAWLAHHLARWGMFVLSIDLAEVNFQTGDATNGPLQQSARAEVMLAAAERMLTAPVLEGRLNPGRIGLVGHSMSGEGVLVAQALSLTRPGLTVRGVVSIAPTNYRPDISMTNANYLQLHGSFDYLLSGVTPVTVADPFFLGLRLYDRAWRHRTHAWIEGARHQGWNPNWWNSPHGFGEGAFSPVEGTLEPDDHAAIGKALINAFFQDSLFSRPEYLGYLEGLVQPQTVRPYVVHIQHQGAPTDVADDMGDADPSLSFPAETPLERTTNRQGGAVAAAGSAVDVWDDLAQSSIANCSQATVASDLAWSDRDLTYRSELPGLIASPTHELSVRATVRYDPDAAGDPDETWNLAGADVDLMVELESGGGSATVRLGAAGTVPYPLPGTDDLAVPRTLRLPLDAFSAVNAAFDPGSLKAVTLRPAGGATGRILIDDIEVAP